VEQDSTLNCCHYSLYFTVALSELRVLQTTYRKLLDEVGNMQSYIQSLVDTQVCHCRTSNSIGSSTSSTSSSSTAVVVVPVVVVVAVAAAVVVVLIEVII